MTTRAALFRGRLKPRSGGELKGEGPSEQAYQTLYDDILREGWHADIGKRPSFLKLGNALRTILDTESGEHRETVSDISSEIFRLTHNQQ